MSSNRRNFLKVGALASCASLATPAVATQSKVTPRAPDYLPDGSLLPETVLNFELSALERARAAVVEVFPEDPRSAHTKRASTRHGSGFFLKLEETAPMAKSTPRLLVVTNSHVVNGHKTVWIKTSEGQVLNAAVRIDDRRSDVAIVEPDIETGVSTLSLANINAKFGEPVAAIGSPFGYAQTVTRGFISNTDVTFRHDDPVDYLQHDAAINHGSSGGPLVNARGEVVGINTAIPDQSPGFAGIGLATPVEHIARALLRYQQKQFAEPSLGLQLQQISPSLAGAISWQNRAGLLVSGIEETSEARKVGIAVGDIIAEVGNTRLNTLRDLGKLLLHRRPGEELSGIKIHRLRRGKLVQEAESITSLPIGEKSSPKANSEQPERKISERKLAHGLVIAREVDGDCVVSEVTSGSAAERAGISPGDIIDLFAMQPCPSPNDLDRLWNQSDSVPVLMRRGSDRPLFITMVRAANDGFSVLGNTTTEISAAY